MAPSRSVNAGCSEVEMYEMTTEQMAQIKAVVGKGLEALQAAAEVIKLRSDNAA